MTEERVLRTLLQASKRHNGSNLVTREHTGVWTGPGVLALIDGEWIHYAPRDLRARAPAFVGMDRPTIAIRVAEEQHEGPQAAPKPPRG